VNEPAPTPDVPATEQSVRFSVVCVDDEGSFFRVHIAAPTAEAAAAQARAQGHVVAITYLDGLSRADQNRILRVLRRSDGACPACGYSLEGLPRKDGRVICPECGYGDPVLDARKRASREIEPGKAFVFVGLFLSFVEAINMLRAPEFPLVGVAGLVMVAIGYERARGRFRPWVLVVAGLVVAAGVLRSFFR
jgi:hypothetical protein